MDLFYVNNAVINLTLQHLHLRYILDLFNVLTTFTFVYRYFQRVIFYYNRANSNRSYNRANRIIKLRIIVQY